MRKYLIRWKASKQILNEPYTGKSLSEALIFAEHGENMLCTEIVLNVKNNFCTQHILPMFWAWNFHVWNCNSMNNLSLYCGLVGAKIRASDKYLPVKKINVRSGCLMKIICWRLFLKHADKYILYLHKTDEFCNSLVRFICTASPRNFWCTVGLIDW